MFCWERGEYLQMDMRDEREVGTEEYIEEGRCYRCGEMKHERKCR